MALPSFNSMPVKIAIVIVAACVILACKFYFGVSNSNPVEVAAEEVIKEETGYDVEPIVSKIP